MNTSNLGLHSICLLALAFAAGCDGPKARFGDMALPADCGSQCPTGFSCDNGICVGGSAQKLDFEVTTYPIAATLTVDGLPPVHGPSCSGAGDQVNLQFSQGPLPQSFFDPVLGTLVSSSLACTNDAGAVTARLPAGSYRVLASRSSSSTSFPDATMVVDGDFKVSAAKSGLVWSPTTVPVSGTLTLDGLPPVVSASSGCSSEQVSLRFLDSLGGAYTASIGCDSTGAFATRLAPGTYHVVATRSITGTSFPDAAVIVQRSFQVSGPSTGLKWNVATVPVSGALTIDGLAPVPTTSSSCSGSQVNLGFIDDLGGSYSATIGCDSTGTFATRLAAGTYHVVATRAITATSFPNASVVVQRSFQVAAATTGLKWNVATVPVSGTIAIDGLAPIPTTSSSCSGSQVNVSFIDDLGGSYSASVGCDSSGAFATRVAAGTYHVVASRAITATSFPDATVVMQHSFQVSAAATGLAWNVATIPVSGTLAIDGLPPVAGTGCSGGQVNITFRDADGGQYSSSIPCDSTGVFAARLAPGTYRVLADRAITNTSFPDATISLVSAITVK
jgi:hypothetical protein